MLTKSIVAPYTGAWIEIRFRWPYRLLPLVAPYTGAWIEIDMQAAQNGWKSCRSLHGSVD